MLDPLETILRQCAEAAPHPWYPSVYARTNSIARDDLDPHLDRLRMAGLIHLTDWVQGQGQGYALTPEGEYALQNPRELAKVRAGKRILSLEALQEPPRSSGGPMDIFERGEEIRAAFLHPSPPVISLTLIFLNVAWFLVEILLSARYHLPLNEFLVGNARQPAQQIALNRLLTETGALAGIFIVQGEWWRLLSCCFVHIGLIHLGLNMWALYAVGPFFEQLWGRARFLVLYLMAGLGGSCTMVIVNPRTLGAGASGALWGILTAHLVWILLNRRYLPGSLASQMLRRIIFFLVINVVFTYSVPNISAAAHFGGGAVGAVTAVLLNGHRFGGPALRRLTLLGLVSILPLCVGAVVVAERIDPQWQLLRIQDAEEELAQMLDARVNPLSRQKLKAHSLQEVQDAVADLEKARARLGHLAAQLQAAGPFQPKAWHEKGQALIQHLEEKVHQYEIVELNTFVHPLLIDEVRRAGRVYEEEYQTIQRLDEDQRTPAVVEQAIDHGRQARQQVEAVLQMLRDMSPLQDPKLEKRRVALLDDWQEALPGWERTEQRMRKLAKTTAPASLTEPK